MPITDAQITENKLILLYILQEKGTVSSIELSDFIVFKGYMDYFSMQELLSDLEKSELIHEEQGVLSLTEAGSSVVSTFRYRIPNSIRGDIQEYAQVSRYGRSSMLEARSEIQPSGERFQVISSVWDYDQEVFRLVVVTDTEEEAYAVRNRWQQNGMRIYRSIIGDLKA